MNQVVEFEVFLNQLFAEKKLLSCSLSKVRNKEKTSYQKVSIRPLELRGSLHYQVTYHYHQKELHENLNPAQTEELISQLLEGTLRQGHFATVDADWQVLVSKKGAKNIIKHQASRAKTDLNHNRLKQYALREGIAYPFLVELGVMNQNGQVLAKRYSKFRQLNKYLEIVEDCLPALDAQIKAGSLTIVDFGSGKAYLTFALYHYLVKTTRLRPRS